MIFAQLCWIFAQFFVRGRWFGSCLFDKTGSTLFFCFHCWCANGNIMCCLICFLSFSWVGFKGIHGTTCYGSTLSGFRWLTHVCTFDQFDHAGTVCLVFCLTVAKWDAFTASDDVLFGNDRLAIWRMWQVFVQLVNLTSQNPAGPSVSMLLFHSQLFLNIICQYFLQKCYVYVTCIRWATQQWFIVLFDS